MIAGNHTWSRSSFWRAGRKFVIDTPAHYCKLIIVRCGPEDAEQTSTGIAVSYESQAEPPDDSVSATSECVVASVLRLLEGCRRDKALHHAGTQSRWIVWEAVGHNGGVLLLKGQQGEGCALGRGDPLRLPVKSKEVYSR